MNAPLCDTYRPATLQDVVGQPKAVTALQRLIDRGALGGRAYWITGASGTGKTTLARIVAGLLAEPCEILETNPKAMNGEVWDWFTRARMYRPMYRGNALIVNEAHGLTGAQFVRLLDELEGIPAHAAVMFTTTHENAEEMEGNDVAPLVSRCFPLPLARRDLAQAFAVRAREIAQKEGLDGQPIEKYARLAQDCKNNLRLMLQKIEAGCMLAGG